MTTLTGREFFAITEEQLTILLFEFLGSKDDLIKLLVRFNRNHGAKVVYDEI